MALRKIEVPPSPNGQHTQVINMSDPTYLLVFFVAVFAVMSAIFALAAFGGYIAPNRGSLERWFSLCIGLIFSIGFARLAIESAGRIKY